MAKSEALALFVKVSFVLCLVIKAAHPQTQEKLSLCELEQLVKSLVHPDDGNELHAISLRNQLRHLLDNNDYMSLKSSSLSEDEKRSLSSIARNGLMNNGKRNIGSLARGGFLRGSPDEIKRSIAALAKNSQLPTSREPETEDNEDTSQIFEKRNIGSVARTGMINGKRNIASLARSYELPPYGKRNLASVLRAGRPSNSFKRNIASLARGNIYPYFGESIKRNVGALARDWSLPKIPTKITVKREASGKPLPDEIRSNTLVKREASDLQFNKLTTEEQKKNVAAPIHEKKVKRETIFDDYENSNSEILQPVYQIPELDYDELNEALEYLYDEDEDDIHEDKRFLGSVVRDGWSAYRPAEKRNIGSLARLGLLRNDFSTYEQQKKYSGQQEKRHIGALARSGWLPSFSPVRGNRFSRSGRARSQIGGYYPQQEHRRQPIAVACERCKSSYYPSPISWAAPGLSTWGPPRKIPAIHQRSLRGPFHPSGDYY